MCRSLPGMRCTSRLTLWQQRIALPNPIPPIKPAISRSCLWKARRGWVNWLVRNDQGELIGSQGDRAGRPPSWSSTFYTSSARVDAALSSTESAKQNSDGTAGKRRRSGFGESLRLRKCLAKHIVIVGACSRNGASGLHAYDSTDAGVVLESRCFSAPLSLSTLGRAVLLGRTRRDGEVKRRLNLTRRPGSEYLDAVRIDSNYIESNLIYYGRYLRPLWICSSKYGRVAALEVWAPRNQRGTLTLSPSRPVHGSHAA
ncbi:hypothetical protein FKP32DRAFT_1605828 [Trametes sanguinea]|nr:hypothetical protein FKP32DRAFT_1605828 [Trametes sanguinea]